MTESVSAPKSPLALVGAKIGTGAALALALAGCSMFAEDKPLPPCPRIGILAEAASLTRFAPGAGRDIIDIAYEGEIQRIAGACEYDLDKKTKAGTINVEIATVFDFARGAADRERKASFGYFIALTGRDKAVMSKQVFTNQVSFVDNQTRVRLTDEPVSITIPITAEQTGKDFEIFVGFDLTREEVEYNRTHRGLGGH